MTRYVGSAVLAGIALIVLIPLLRLSLTIDRISTFLVKINLPFSPPIDQTPGGSAIKMTNENELIYRVGDISYFTPTHSPLLHLNYVPDVHSTDDEGGTYWPFTILRLPLNGTAVDVETIRSIVDAYSDTDDVFTKSWLESVALVPDYRGQESIQTMVDRDALAMLQADFGVKRFYLDHTIKISPSIVRQGPRIKLNRLSPSSVIPSTAQGPFLASNSGMHGKTRLFPVYRLYSDKYRAFLYGIYRSPLDIVGDRPGTYHALRAVDEQGYNLIPVPSRLYGREQAPDGISGSRIGVKDIYDLKGVTTGAGCRAYGELYGHAKESASTLLRLESLGGVFVGKTKTAAFAYGSRGNGDTLDEQYPFSARADGWQTCAGSSSGSACAMGAYDWLDFALGSDTWGSVRGPAARVGLYGNRPSTGMVPLDGIIPSSNYSDTAGVLARDPNGFDRFIDALYGDSLVPSWKYTQLPANVLLPTAHLRQANDRAQEVLNGFMSTLKHQLGISVTEIDLDEHMADHNFTQARMQEIMGQINTGTHWWSYKQTGEKFINDYAELHSGQHAPLDPWVRDHWEFAASEGSWSLYNESTRGALDFKQYFNEEILIPDQRTCSQNILIYDIGTGGKEDYREDELNSENDNGLFGGAGWCSLAGCVDYTIPIGQVPFQSVISHVEEQKAVTISLVAYPGCDFMLLDFVRKLAEKGLISAVKAGRTAY